MEISVIGGGVMGQKHAASLLKLGLLGHIIETDRSRHAALQEQFGDRIVTSLDKTSSSGYVVATPSSSHHAVAKEILKARKPILIEKPVCGKLDEALDLLKWAGQTVVCVGYIERFNAAVQAALDWSHDKAVTRLESFRLSPRPARIADVGVLLDLASHDIDTQLFVMADDVVQVSCQVVVPEGFKHEHKAIIELLFENGATGLVEASWMHTERVRLMRMTSEEEACDVDYLKQTFSVEGQLTNLPKQADALSLEHLNFADAIEGKSEPMVSLEDAIDVLRILEAAQESVRMGAPVEPIYS